MRLRNTALSLVGAAVLLSHGALCQDGGADTTFVAEATASAVAGYDRALYGQVVLFNGSEYVALPEPYEGFPFFGSEYWEEGSIHYSGELFHQVTMEYDLVQDVLIIEHYDQRGYAAEVKLHNDLVQYFDLLGHHFINVPDDSASGGLRGGFYDLLYDGDMKVLCKRKKSVHETVEGGMVSVSFLERNIYYLLRNGQAYQLRNKTSVLKLLANKKRALKQFARANTLNNDDKEKMIVSLVRHYESLD